MIAGRSASALKRCGFAVKLNKLKRPAARSEAAKKQGNDFHAGVEKWVETGILPPHEDPDVDGWLTLLASKLALLPGMRTEVAVGLGMDGAYIPVTETSPHVYDSGEGGPELATAGRTDLVWTEETRLGKTCFQLDWKTGVWQPETPKTNLQQWALGLACCQMMAADAVVVGLYHVRDGVFEWSDPAPRGSTLWKERWADVLAAATVGDRAVRGEPCIPCWEKSKCEFYEEPSQ